jgi:glucokinase
VTTRADPRGGVAYGVDIGGTKVLGVALDASDELVAEARVPTPPSTDTGSAAGHVADAVAEVVGRLDAEASGSGSFADAGSGTPVGVGVPGMVDRQGHLVFAPNLPQAQGLEWPSLLEDRMGGRAIVVENDANLAVLAEHELGAARGFRHVVMVTLGTGIGGGIVVDGSIQVGSSGFAGEIGHMVVDPSGPPCPCGRRGCWERYASGAGLGIRAREAAMAGRLHDVVQRSGGDPESVRGEDVSAAAAAGDPEARQVIEEVGWWVGFGLANLAGVLDPECFVLGGGLVGAGDLLVNSARRAYEDLVEGGSRRPVPRVVAAAFGERAGAVGAALSARLGGLQAGTGDA